MLEDTIRSYEHWLIGRPFIVVTDSQAMLSLMRQKHLSPRQWRTVTYLSKFDITFEFVEGKKNIIADLLSRIAERSTYKHDLPFLEESEAHLAAIQLRRGKMLLEKPLTKRRNVKTNPTNPSEPEIQAPEMPDEPSETVSESTDQRIDQSDGPEALPMESMSTLSLSQFRQAIIDGYKDNTQFSKALKTGVDSGIYKVKNGLLYLAFSGKDERLCIPNIKVEGGRDKATKKSLREMLISHAHEILGHKATIKTDALLRSQFYWKTMTEDTNKYVRSCHSCQTRNAFPTKQHGKNHPLPVPAAPWQTISMDFMVNLPSSAIGDLKFNALYVVVDLLSKMTRLIPTTTNVKVEGVAKLYFDNIYKLHGLPKGIVSDRDTKFTGAFWRALQKMVGTDLMMSTTSHPQTDGQTERANRSILQILRHFVNLIGSDWAQHLPTVEFAINSAVSTSTGKAPFELIYGYLPRTFPPIVYDEDNPASMNFIENRMLAQRSAQDAIIAAKTEQSHYVNLHRKDDPEINVGDLVLVSNESQLSQLPKGRQKLAIKDVGPYKVTKVDRTTSNYTLDIPNSKRFNTFHIDSIKKYTDPHLELFPNRQRRQPRVVQAEEDLNLEIEKVIGHERRRNGVISFLCKWESFSNEDSTYRAAEDFKSSPYGIKVVKDYLLSFGETPDDLREWMDRTDWIRDVIREAQEVSNEGSQGA